ncbi:fatty acyl-CoA reductase 1-like, partial [Hyposmocoma kahamanoa]|uniref:fatty acyl-CoA reductase 1-like n=1 Tax=Hyposmocoma kahamanoa TaxID=1477025 RepID=UPI000E6D6B0F
MDSALAIDVSYLAQQKALYDIIEKGGSDIQQFYKGANIFITGSSGFIGKQLVEKLVRSCDVKKIYLLLRSKKGMSAQERLEKICQNTIWDTLRKKQPNFHEKLEAVPGDVTELRLGICEQDWKRITEE